MATPPAATGAEGGAAAAGAVPAVAPAAGPPAAGFAPAGFPKKLLRTSHRRGACCQPQRGRAQRWPLLRQGRALWVGPRTHRMSGLPPVDMLPLSAWESHRPMLLCGHSGPRRRGAESLGRADASLWAPFPRHAAMETTPYIGASISLVSKAGIRYEGTLFTIDTQQSNLALQNGACTPPVPRARPRLKLCCRALACAAGEEAWREASVVSPHRVFRGSHRRLTRATAACASVLSPLLRHGGPQEGRAAGPGRQRGVRLHQLPGHRHPGPAGPRTGAPPSAERPRLLACG